MLQPFYCCIVVIASIISPCRCRQIIYCSYNFIHTGISSYTAICIEFCSHMFISSVMYMHAYMDICVYSQCVCVRIHSYVAFVLAILILTFCDCKNPLIITSPDRGNCPIILPTASSSVSSDILEYFVICYSLARLCRVLGETSSKLLISFQVNRSFKRLSTCSRSTGRGGRPLICGCSASEKLNASAI